MKISDVECMLAYWDEQAIVADAWPRTTGKPGRDPRYVAIGELVGHSTKVIFLDTNKYGGPLEFDGEVSGWLWPSSNELRRWRGRGRPPLDWRARLDDLMGEGAEYFVSSPAEELPQQRELFRFVSQHHPLISDAAQYTVFDLRRRL